MCTPTPPATTIAASGGPIFVGCLLSAACAINWLGVAAVLDDARHYYGKSPMVLDMVSNLYLGLYCLTCMPCGFIVDRKGVRFATLCGAVTQAAGAALCTAFGQGFWALVLGSCVAAVGQPLVVSTAPAFARAYAPNWTSRATSIISVSNNVGSAVAYLAAPRLARVGGMRGWLGVRALYSVGCLVLAWTCLGQTEVSEPQPRYARQALRVLLQPALAVLLLAYAVGQGAFWAWAELLDAALLPAGLSEKKIGDIGAIVTLVASFIAVIFGALIDASAAPIKRLQSALGLAQSVAALAAFATAAAVRAKSEWAVGVAWFCFSTASTPIMPLGAQLAALQAPPHLVGAILSALFLGAELLSTAFGFALAGLDLAGAALVAAIAAITTLAALSAVTLPCLRAVSPYEDQRGSLGEQSLGEQLLPTTRHAASPSSS